MGYRTLITIALTLLWHSAALAHPLHTSNQPPTTGKDTILQPRLTPADPSSLNIINASIVPSNDGITCFTQGTHTNVTGCRPTLNHFRTFPAYRKVQTFHEGVSPKLPKRPPLIIYHRHSTCAVEIEAANPSVEDRFSFEQVRGLATDIVEDCQTKGGFGGFASIGVKEGVGGWTVRVIGFVEEVGEVGRGDGR